jgi:hypothetical protein
VPNPTAVTNKNIQVPVTMRPVGKTPSANPGTTNGVGKPAALAANCSWGFPRSDLGSVTFPAALEKTPATKEDSVEERVVLTTLFVCGFVAEIAICGMRSGWNVVLHKHD